MCDLANCPLIAQMSRLAQANKELLDRIDASAPFFERVVHDRDAKEAIAERLEELRESARLFAQKRCLPSPQGEDSPGGEEGRPTSTPQP